MKNKILLAVVFIQTAILLIVSLSIKKVTEPIVVEEGREPIIIRL